MLSVPLTSNYVNAEPEEDFPIERNLNEKEYVKIEKMRFIQCMTKV